MPIVDTLRNLGTFNWHIWSIVIVGSTIQSWFGSHVTQITWIISSCLNGIFERKVLITHCGHTRASTCVAHLIYWSRPTFCMGWSGSLITCSSWLWECETSRYMSRMLPMPLYSSLKCEIDKSMPLPMLEPLFTFFLVTMCYTMALLYMHIDHCCASNWFLYLVDYLFNIYFVTKYTLTFRCSQ